MNKRVSEPPASMIVTKGLMTGFLPSWLLAQAAEQRKTSVWLVVLSHPATDIILTRQLNRNSTCESGVDIINAPLHFSIFVAFIEDCEEFLYTASGTHRFIHMDSHTEPKSAA